MPFLPPHRRGVSQAGRRRPLHRDVASRTSSAVFRNCRVRSFQLPGQLAQLLRQVDERGLGRLDRAVVRRERQDGVAGGQQHEQGVPVRVAAVVPDHGTVGPVAVVSHPAAGVVLEERRVQPLPARPGQQDRLGSKLPLQVNRAVPRQVADRHVNGPRRCHERGIVGTRREGVYRYPTVRQDQVPQWFLIRARAPRRPESRAQQSERSEHPVPNQGLVRLPGDGLRDVAGDRVADVGVAETLAAGSLRLAGEHPGDEAPPLCDQLLQGVGPHVLDIGRKVGGSARAVRQQMVQRASAPAVGHLDLGQQRRHVSSRVRRPSSSSTASSVAVIDLVIDPRCQRSSTVTEMPLSRGARR